MKVDRLVAPPALAVKTYDPAEPVTSPIRLSMLVFDVACIVSVLADAPSSRPLAMDTREAEERLGDDENDRLSLIVLATKETVTSEEQPKNILVT